MHAARNLLPHKKLLDFTIHRLLFDSRSLSSNTGRKLLLSHRLSSSSQRASHSGSRYSDEESRVSSNTGDPDENPSVWTFYDPLEGKIITSAEGLDKGSNTEDESPRDEISVQKKPVRKVKKMEEECGKEDEKSRGLSVSGLQGWASAVRKKAVKVKVSWVCENCGDTQGQWWGTCPSCQVMNTMKKFSEPEISKATGLAVSGSAVRSWLPQGPAGLVPQRLIDVNKGMNQSDWRITLSGEFGMEVSRVLGGGVVPGSLVLVGGDPGVGKSTLLLQIAAVLAEGLGLKAPIRVIYVSGEESIEQIGNRADRMGIETPELFLYSSTDIEDILEKIQALSPQALVVDSIQTMYLGGVAGSAGNVTQVKECTSALLRFAKQTNIPVLLIGHVTKTGDIAGPRMLEHIVDVVLYLEGERYSSYRLLRSVKNRFGTTDELGIFEMSQSGLQAVSNPSEMFLSDGFSDSEVLAGLAVAVIVDGSRTFLIEIQALCASGSSVTRQVNGIPATRADMIISVLMKQAGLKIQDNAIFLNVVSGFKLTETAGDLAVAAAICSSFLEFPIPNDVAFIGEIGLGGELRMVPRMDKRISAVAKLGYKKCVIPKSAEKLLGTLDFGITVLGCRNLKEVINAVFRTD